MKERIELVLNNYAALVRKDPDAIAELKSVYSIVYQIELADCPKCLMRAFTELRKYHHLNFNQMESKTDRKYILKPGNHSFVPGSPSIHNNDNTSDADAAFYLEAFPHIESLFEKTPKKEKEAKKIEAAAAKKATNTDTESK